MSADDDIFVERPDGVYVSDEDWARIEAEGRERAAASRAATAIASTADTYRLLWPADLAAMQPPAFLLEDMLPENGFGVLFGPSGTGKSFLALDWALCVAAGLAWYGKPARQAPVVYIAAEGSSGLGVRVAAWQTARRVAAPDSIVFLPEAVNLLDREQLGKAIRTIATLDAGPALIVVDTMARTMVGGEENSAKDVGTYIDAIDRLRRPHQAAVLLVHHTGKNGDLERGSSALRGAADVVHALKPEGAGIRLHCEKTKDHEAYSDWNLHLAESAESCVLRLGTDLERISPTERKILAAVSESFGTDWTSGTKIFEVAEVAKSSFYRSLKSLQERGFIATDGPPARARYAITTDGLAQLVPISPNQSQGTAQASPSHTPTFRGWDWDSGQGADPDATADLIAFAEYAEAKYGSAA